MGNRQSKAKIGTILLTILSLGLLIPGLILPILSIDIGAKIPILGEISLHHTKQSIVETIQSLFRNGNALVGFLIVLFSIVVPLVKAILILFAIFTANVERGNSIQKLLNMIGKWSMADVFIVGIFIAFLSTHSEDSISASIHSGFYFFLGYCLISILAFQIFTFSKPDATIDA